MAINSTFYATVNDLTTLASGGAITGVIDYASFIDAGRKIANLSGSDFANAFLGAFINKVHLTLKTARDLAPAYEHLNKGSVPANGIIEVPTFGFYDAESPLFLLGDDGTSVDQYKIKRPVVNVDYYLDDNPLQMHITIQRAEFEGAWRSPEAMDAFLTDIMIYFRNSMKLQRENSRLGLIASEVVSISGETAATSAEDAAQVYPLLTLYNDIAETELDEDNALYNTEFVRFAIAMIMKVRSKMKKVSVSFNKNEVKWFTPSSNLDIYLNSALYSAMSMYVHPDFYKDDTLSITNFIEIPYWQSEAAPLEITYKSGNSSATTDPVLALVCDDLALGEYTAFDRMDTTPFNAAGLYYNVFYNAQTKLLRNENANAVIFTLA